MHRLFVALALPLEVRLRLAGLAGGIPGARWVEPEQMHLTLRFIGECDGAAAEDIDAALADIVAPAFTLTLEGLGQFGQGRHARALWAGVEASPDLVHLQQKVESAVVRAGVPAEERRFSPHVTLARLNHAPPERLQRFIEGNGLLRAGPFPVTSFVLFDSLRGADHAVYRPLAEYPLDPGRRHPA